MKEIIFLIIFLIFNKLTPYLSNLFKLIKIIINRIKYFKFLINLKYNIVKMNNSITFQKSFIK